ncbi:MAG: hypothetical protein KZQ73_06575 [Candidatus Thiodiazotropha sp. (ex Semelilucina semeliformis)]|nr:hypothetical protein [Candidatus Thiodiazotropha sp. (ex Myrtea spinifera)]MCU7807519.1 hypothetical protein [Candidatus Thiodiazotropha sp. (ex Semelilucina semeliformis)]MCU7827475.1 hypothetical protein [Candidatus Thiodiazotropha sp. (ex Myrtea sp. 'scaly one' KF741663)]
MKQLFVIFLLVTLTACSQRYVVSDDPNYPYNLPPVGSTIVLKKTVSVPAGEVRVFLQGGVLMNKSEFDRYKANCSFELRKLDDIPRDIEPDSFIVTEVQRTMEQVVKQLGPEQGFVKVGFDIGGKPMVTRGYHLWLGSDRQPDVMRMTCRGSFDDLNRADPPSLGEVRYSLGEFAELVMPI